MLNKIVANAEDRMKKALEAARRELAGIRTGKASPALLDTVRVEAYGQHVSLKEVGQVSAPEPRLLVVQPWDKALVKVIAKAIQPHRATRCACRCRSSPRSDARTW